MHDEAYFREKYIRTLREQIAAGERLLSLHESALRDLWANHSDEQLDELLTALWKGEDLSRFCSELTPDKFLRSLACVTVSRVRLRRVEVELLNAENG